MRIAIISTAVVNPWGGSEELWAACAEAALAQGHAVLVSLHRESAEAARVRELARRGARVHGRRVIPPNRLGRAYSRYIQAFAHVLRWKPDVVLLSQGGTYDLVYNGQASAFAAAGVPYIVVCHGNDERVLNDADRATAAELFTGAGRVCFVARRMIQLAQRQLACDLVNATVVSNPVNMAETTAVAWPAGARDGPARLATVGRLDVHAKGYDLLIETLAGGPWKERTWELTFYGDGPGRAYLEALARYYGLESRVRFAGPTGDVRAAWAANHALLQTSRTEGVPLALVEAMLCGRPAIVTDVGGMSEWVEDRATGFLAAGATVEAIGRALERAWERRGDWAAMGRAAHERAAGRMEADPGGALLRIVTEASARRAEKT